MTIPGAPAAAAVAANAVPSASLMPLPGIAMPATGGDANNAAAAAAPSVMLTSTLPAEPLATMTSTLTAPNGMTVLVTMTAPVEPQATGLGPEGGSGTVQAAGAVRSEVAGLAAVVAGLMGVVGVFML